MGQDFDPTTPGDSSFISVFPANERAERLAVETWASVEHYEGAGNEDRHKIGTHADDTARDAVITTPQDGNFAFQEGSAAAADAPRDLAVSFYNGSDWLKLYPCFTGMVTMAAFDVATPPEGWLPCDGAAVVRATYADLFAVIGTAFDQQAGIVAPAGTDFRVPLIAGQGVVGLTSEKHGQAGWVRKVGTLHDLHVAGTFSGSARLVYIIEIITAAAPDTFRWSDDAGDTWQATGDITASNALNNGLSAVFAATTGHADGDIWIFVADPASATVGSMMGVDGWQLVSDEMPVHTHVMSGSTATDGSHRHTDNAFANGGTTGHLRRGDVGSAATATSYPRAGLEDGNHAHAIGTIAAANAGDDRAHDNAPHAIVLGHLIKT